jgi:ribose/xylose/arabinose/galactoside ABC-type transport system permease subunit
MEPRLLRVLEALLGNSLLLATAVLVIVYSIVARHLNFFTFENLVNILISATVGGFLTWGLAVTMLAGNIDFSSQGVSAFASIAMGVLFMQQGWGALPTLVAVALACAILGLLTSLLIVNFKIPGLVATIAVNGSYVATAMFLCSNYQINIRRPELENLFFRFRILDVPFSVWLMLAFFAFTWLVLNHTKLGAHIYASGANPTAARLSGVRVNWVVRITLMWAALCVALAAMIQTARSGITLLFGSSGGLLAGDYLGPVVLGGISIFGGSGKLEDMLVAIAFTSVLYNGLYLMNVSTGVIRMVIGLVFLIAILMSAARGWFAKMKA